MNSVEQSTIREINERLVKEAIIKNGSISRADISRNINLNKASVSEIISGLLEKKIFIEMGNGDSLSGRKPILIGINKNAGYSVSCDIRKTSIRTVAISLDNTILLEKNLANIKIESNSIFSILSKIIDEYKHEIKGTVYGLIGIAIGIHGIVIGDEVRFSPFYDLEKINLKIELENFFSTHVIVENEANLSVLGEKFVRTDISNIISIMVYDGIGAGIINNDSLFRGHGHYAGEVGHMVVDFKGKKCRCGNLGCIEQYASEINILKEYAKSQNMENIDFAKFKDDYENEVPEAISLVDDFVYYISIIINNTALTLSPRLIIINSKFTNGLTGVIEKIKGSLNCKTTETLKIEASTIGNKSILLGGFFLNRNSFLKIKDVRD